MIMKKFRCVFGTLAGFKPNGGPAGANPSPPICPSGRDRRRIFLDVLKKI